MIEITVTDLATGETRVIRTESAVVVSYDEGEEATVCAVGRAEERRGLCVVLEDVLEQMSVESPSLPSIPLFVN